MLYVLSVAPGIGVPPVFAFGSVLYHWYVIIPPPSTPTFKLALSPSIAFVSVGSLVIFIGTFTYTFIGSLCIVFVSSPTVCVTSQ